MANEKHLELIGAGVTAWNSWRDQSLGITPNLDDADLEGLDLTGVNLKSSSLRGVNLSGAKVTGASLCNANLKRANLHMGDFQLSNFTGANLIGVDLSGANLSGADLSETNLSVADLRGANLRQANLTSANVSEAQLNEADLQSAVLGGANLRGADLRGASLVEAILDNVNFGLADLSGADLNLAVLAWTTFGNNDLSTVRGLDTVKHFGPSSIGVDTLFRSNGKIPHPFLRGAGIAEDFITFLPSIVGRAIEFYSCFISYSHKDEQFSEHLSSRMRGESLRVWYAPEDMKGGKKLHEEIFRAIQVHDKLLLVLSENSMQSEWVRTEIRRALKVEREEHRRKLFPIRLVDFEAIQKWECFDADSSKDLAVELREYYIPDFSNWKDFDAFEAEFAKLLDDLRAMEQ